MKLFKSGEFLKNDQVVFDLEEDDEEEEEDEDEEQQQQQQQQFPPQTFTSSK